MKILVVTGYLAPYAPFSAVRCPKFIRFLLENGHDVRVLGADNRKNEAIVAREFPEEIAFYAPFRDARDRIHDFIGGKRGKRGKRGEVSASRQGNEQHEKIGAKPGRVRSWINRVGSDVLYNLFALPDSYRTWGETSPGHVLEHLAGWKPDIVYASAPPHSSLIAASTLAAFWGVPWVAEYRDLWTEHPYYKAPFWRRLLERRLERRVGASAAGYVTVTRSWAQLLERRGKPVLLAMNGFDPTEYPSGAPRQDADGKLKLLYCGSLYGGMRDPTPLLEALARLGPDAERIRLVFHCPESALLGERAEALGISGCVDRRELLPRGEILAEEMAADILLLLRWDDPREDSVIAGKLFEYIGAGRPILSVGRTSGEAASILRENALGKVSNDPDEIAALLADCLEKGVETAMGYRPSSVSAFERPTQFRKIEAFLEDILGKPVD